MNRLSTATDNIFLNNNTNTDFSIQPCPNDLSDHDALLLILNNIQLHIPTMQYTISRLINEYTLFEFQSTLSYESWDFAFNNEDVDTIFNKFLNMYLRIFNHSFPCKQFANKHNTKPWICRGIIISSQHKRDLFVLCRVTKDTKLTNHYKKYTKVLSDVVKSAKYKYYNQLLLNANNNSKIAWNIIKSVTNKKTVNHDISIIDANGKIYTDYQNIADAFNKYFTSLPDTTSVINPTATSKTQANVSPLDYLKLSLTKPFSKIQLTPVTFNEIIAICKSLKYPYIYIYPCIYAMFLSFLAIAAKRLSLTCLSLANAHCCCDSFDRVV